MSEETARPWRTFYDDDASKHVICEKANVLVIIAELDREEDAAAIVCDHNAHGKLVEALEKIQTQTQEPAIEKLAGDALEEAKP